MAAPANTTPLAGLLAGCARSLTAGLVAGLVVGPLGGLGARIAMRITAIGAGPAFQGSQTDNGEIVGQITVEGSLFVIISVGLITGVAAALWYVGIRPLLPASSGRRALANGIVVLLVVSPAVIGAAPADFARLGPLWLNLLTFGVLFVGVGAATAWLTDAIERRRPQHSDAHWIGAAVALGLGLLLTVELVLPASSLSLALIPVAFAGWRATLGAPKRDAPPRPSRERVLDRFGLLALATPCLVGAALLVAAVVDLAG